MNQAQTISHYHPMLHSIAYRLLKCQADAEDVVQDTFLKWLSAEQDKIQNTKAYLITAVTNNCLSHLDAIKRKKASLDNFQFSEFFAKFKDHDTSYLDLDHEIKAALTVIQVKLEPLERVVYVLKEVFDFDYEIVQQVVDKKADNCRQLLSRAKKKLSEESTKINLSFTSTQDMFVNFKKACERGNPNDFINDLKKDFSVFMQKKSA
jgi:RNA polymerase sigma factor (sigma-70 family)